MTQDVAYATNLFPGNFWSKSGQIVWNVPAGFGNDLDTALDTVAKQPIATKIFQCLAGRSRSDATQGRNDLGEDRLDPTGRHQNTRTVDRSISAFNIG